MSQSTVKAGGARLLVKYVQKATQPPSSSKGVVGYEEAGDEISQRHIPRLLFMQAASTHVKLPMNTQREWPT